MTHSNRLWPFALALIALLAACQEQTVVTRGDANADAEPPSTGSAEPAAPDSDTPAPSSPGTSPSSEATMKITTDPFGTTSDGQQIMRYTCAIPGGLEMQLINYGAIVVSLKAPDRNGQLENVNVGFDKLDGYLLQHPFFGATVGRYCNRIAGGQFSLEGKQYTLATNNGPNHLHGGVKGFDKVVWKAETVQHEDAVGVRFTYTSRDGEEGYPGNLQATATYTINEKHEWKIEFTATTDQATPVNLTNHNYWNLAGATSGSILDHELMIAADQYLPVDETLIPTGELADVAGTPMDFREATKIGARIEELGGDPQGYDHCFVVRGERGQLRLAARVKDPGSGRMMEIHTTQPGVQFYTGNFLDGSEANGGLKQHEAFCLETQHFPDSPNQPSFPSTILQPGQTYHQTTVHRFSAE